MKKFLSILTISAFLLVGANVVMAGNGDSKPCPPSSPNAGAIGEPCGFGGDNDIPNANAEGNFDIDVFAIGGGLSFDGELIPNGAAGGIGAAGGVAAGEAEGSFESFRFFRKTINLGSAEGNLKAIGGGMTKTEAYDFNQPGGSGPYDLAIGVGSETDNFAETGGHLSGGATGLAYSAGGIAGAAGQASLNGSILTGSPLPVWDSKGVTGVVAGQGSLGAFIGGGIAAGYGDYEVGADIWMHGNSEADSYRAVDFFPGGHTEYMASYGRASTEVQSYGYANDNHLATSFVTGGYVAAGGVKTATIQAVNTGLGGGIAKSSANGSYSGSGDLGTNFNGKAEGYSKTSATTLNGYNGAIMTSGAGMKVSSSQPTQPN